MQISNSVTGFLKRALDKQLNICDWDYLIVIESKMSENIKRTLTYIFENWEIKFVAQVGSEIGPSRNDVTKQKGEKKSNLKFHAV